MNDKTLWKRAMKNRCPRCGDLVKQFRPGGAWSWVKWECLSPSCHELWGDDDVKPKIDQRIETTIEPMIQEWMKFKKYHAANPNVYRLFLKYAREVRLAGFTRYSVWAIINRIRWHHDINTPKEGEFKISNDYIAWYARQAIVDYPEEFKGFFKLKKLPRL